VTSGEGKNQTVELRKGEWVRWEQNEGLSIQQGEKDQKHRRVCGAVKGKSRLQIPCGGTRKKKEGHFRGKGGTQQSKPKNFREGQVKVRNKSVLKKLKKRNDHTKGRYKRTLDHFKKP